MSFNSLVGLPDDLIETYPVGCPKCGDEGLDVYNEDEDDND